MLLQEGYTPLCLASFSGNCDLVRALLENGAHVNKQSNVSSYTKNNTVTLLCMNLMFISCRISGGSLH